MDSSAAETILHIDLDAFFYAMEEVRDPSLMGKPVIVAGGLGNRGVVTTASYEARKYGIRSAMPLATARRLCPQGVFLASDHAYYSQGSKAFHAILRDISPLVQPAGMDEAYIDVRGCEPIILHGRPGHVGEAAARLVRERVRAEIGISASVGVSTNKLVSKVASDAAKPDGLLLVPAGTEAAFLAPMPLRALPGIGRRTEEELARLGLRTLGDLQRYPAALLGERFGSYGQELARHARGESEGRVEEEHGPPRFISRETTFGDNQGDKGYLRAVLRWEAEQVGHDLRQNGLYARTVSVKYRFADFETHSRSQTLARPTSLDGTIFRTAADLLDRAMRAEHRPLRLLGVAVSNLTGEAERQLRFERDGEERELRLNEALDRLRDRYGRRSVETGLTRYQDLRDR